MGDKTAIEWTDATWNPTIGCSKVSAGCDNCYAIGVVHRAMQPAHAGLTLVREGERPDWTGEIRYVPERLDQPLRWKRARQIFVNSLSDLFHPELLTLNVDDRFGTSWPVLAEIVAVMVRADQHVFQVLTKRPQIMAAVLNEPRFRLDVNAILMRDGHEVMPGGFETPWPRHIWWGTSIDEDRYAFRADHLRATPAGIRFLSLEPLLGALPSLDLTDIDWVIVGGESGPGARPMHPEWVRDLRDRCVDTGVAFHFKQWGAWASYTHGGIVHADELTAGHRQTIIDIDGTVLLPDAPCAPEREPSLFVRRPKKVNGRILDGRTWDEFPQRGTDA